MNLTSEDLKQRNQEDLSALNPKKESVYILTDRHWQAVISLLRHQTDLLPSIAETIESLATTDDILNQFLAVRDVFRDEVVKMTASYQEFQSQVGKLNEQNSTAQKALMDTILSQYSAMQKQMFRRMLIWGISLATLFGLVIIFLK